MAWRKIMTSKHTVLDEQSENLELGELGTQTINRC